MLDRRLNAFRSDIAEKRLEGQVEALRFVEGKPARVIASNIAVRPKPSVDSGIDTELLFGETDDALACYERALDIGADVLSRVALEFLNGE